VARQSTLPFIQIWGNSRSAFVMLHKALFYCATWAIRVARLQYVLMKSNYTILHSIVALFDWYLEYMFADQGLIDTHHLSPSDVYYVISAGVNKKL
jgi:hypothetical protein